MSPILSEIGALHSKRLLGQKGDLRAESHYRSFQRVDLQGDLHYNDQF